MDTSVLRFSCPQCGQHLAIESCAVGQPVRCPSCGTGFAIPAGQAETGPNVVAAPAISDQLASGRTFFCPRCRFELGTFTGFHEVKGCARCGWKRAGSGEPDAAPPETPRRWVNAVGLLLIGALSPLLVLAAVAVSLSTGPLALIVAPAAGILVAKLLGGFVYAREGSRWFWYYVGAGCFAWLPAIGWMIWGNHTVSNPDNGWGGFALGLGMLLQLGAIVFWLLGAVWAWLAATKPD